MKKIQEWIETARARKLKIGERLLAAEECDLIIEVLQAIAAELEFESPT